MNMKSVWGPLVVSVCALGVSAVHADILSSSAPSKSLLDSAPKARLKTVGFPLFLRPGGDMGKVTIKNVSEDVIAHAIAPDLRGTALEKHIILKYNNCIAVEPQSSCEMKFQANSNAPVVNKTPFLIKAINSPVVIGQIAIVEDSSAR